MLRTGLLDLAALLPRRRDSVQVGHLIGHHHAGREKHVAARHGSKGSVCHAHAARQGGAS